MTGRPFAIVRECTSTAFFIYPPKQKLKLFQGVTFSHARQASRWISGHDIWQMACICASTFPENISAKVYSPSNHGSPIDCSKGALPTQPNLTGWE